MDSGINQDQYVEINAQLSMAAYGTAMTVYKFKYEYYHVFLQRGFLGFYSVDS